jgi:3-oxoacyl-[acyl-carrier-protein] synthase II
MTGRIGTTKEDRVWITGTGLVTALGQSVGECWPRLLRGDRGLLPLTLFDGSGQRATMVGGVTGALPPEAGKRWSRTSAFAWHAAREAMTEAGLETKRVRTGLVVAGTTGGMFETEARLARLHSEPDHIDSLMEMISQPLTATGDRLVEQLGPFARVRSLCSACSSGANALVVGALWLLSGEVDAVVAGGCDGLCRLTLSGFNALGATDPEPCRPFDVSRKGLNLGEGAGFVVLERASTATERGGAPIAELAGWALGAEAHHITNPEPTGVAAAAVITRCLERARLSPQHVDYVNAHGTATQLNDPMESAAIHRALGSDVERIPVSSSKGQLGHMLGAAGAVEAILSALTVRHQMLLPTMGLTEPDPECPLVHVLHEGRSARVRATLSSSFGFGGLDTVLLITEPELGPPHATGPSGRRVVITGVATITPAGLDPGDTASRLVDGTEIRAPGHKLVDQNLGALLDAARARRLDRPARLAAVVAERALGQADEGATPVVRGEVGVILGTAFGSLDASAAFMHRLFEKGPRFASPAEFPNLVPSSPTGHVSIYLGLQRAALATADLATSGESAILQAVELVLGGEGEVIVAGAVEEASDLVERILVSLDPTSTRAGRARSEGAATLVIEAEEHALARGRSPLARVEHALAWADVTARPVLAGPRDPANARVVSTGARAEVIDLLAGSGWSGVVHTSVSPSAGEHEGIGATAVVAAASMVHRGIAREVLVVGVTRGRGYAITLSVPSP